ncbi:DUF3298 and DUF4163 domain-containing protein [Bacillus massiliigorillae]|uniref:DUF3298 and DUF4163 domain-containing protein n=1 Tax=Bacillus massiliigorillae TaxID=1243664 RepID=UPI0003A9EC4C|nr:DUF3298 and DUF4163 domain-containing protein [Bacillus massiliigorillae]
MKKLKVLKVIIILALFLGVIPVGSSAANATSSQITATAVYYKNIKDLAYPKLSGIKNTKVQNNINMYFQQKAKAHYDSYSALKRDTEAIQGDEICTEIPTACIWSYKSSYKLIYQDSNYISIIMYTDIYTGGIHGFRAVDTYNFNINTGKKILLTDIVKPSKATKTKQYIYNYFKKAGILFTDVTIQDIKLNQYSTFIFTNTGISVIYQEYEIAPYANGNPKANIPSSVYR